MAITPAEAFLREILADGNEHPSTAVRAEAEARGLTWRSVERAKTKLPELVTRQQGFQGRRLMRLPKPTTADPKRFAGWPEYTAVTCLNCGQIAGMYPNPDTTT